MSSGSPDVPSEEIESETGLSYREQLTARKHLVSRGILIETNKRLEHKIYYLIDCEKLDCVMSQPIATGRPKSNNKSDALTLHPQCFSYITASILVLLRG